MEANNSAIDMILCDLDKSNDVSLENGNSFSTIENIEKYITDKFDEVKLSNLKFKIINEVKADLKKDHDLQFLNSNNFLYQKQIDSLSNEITFLREELKEKKLINQVINE